MKKDYTAQLPADRHGVPPPALFKFGALHVMKGLNTLNSREMATTWPKSPTAWARPPCTSW